MDLEDLKVKHGTKIRIYFLLFCAWDTLGSALGPGFAFSGHCCQTGIWGHIEW